MTKRLILMLLLSCSPLWATTYYVDNCVSVGNDLNNGTSPSTPWQTINKVNTSKFNPGDSILFQSTCTWREELIVPSSGAAGSPITFGAYGTGAAPIMSGANLFTSWTSSAGSLYYASYSTAPNQVFEDGARLTQNTASAASLSAGQWYLDTVNSRIWVYLTAGDNPSGHTIEASVRTNAILISGQPYVTVQGIDAEKAADQNINSNGPYLVINRVISGNAVGSGIQINGSFSQSTPLLGNIVENSTIAYNGTFGITSQGNASSLLVQYNSVHHNCWAMSINCGGIYIASDNTGPGGTPAERPTNVIVQYNSVFANYVNLQGSGYGIWFDTIGAGSQIRYNTTWGNSMSGIRLEYSSDVGSTWTESVFGNVSFNNGVGIELARHSHHSVIANNTMWGNTLFNLYVNGEGSDSIGMDNNIISNNIAVGGSRNNLLAAYGGENDGTNGSGNVYTYNDFGPAAGGFIQWGVSAFYSTYSAWETAPGNCGAAGCSHSVQSAPTFASASAGQFWLTSGSPGIGEGLNLGSPYNIGLMPGSSWPNSVVTGDQNAYGSGWEIGAFIYVPALAPPSNLQAVAH